MSLEFEYRRLAAACLDLPKRAAILANKTRLLLIAEAWLELADRVTRRDGNAKHRSGNGGYGTHYVVLGYELRWPSAAVPRPDDQHIELRWWPVAELLASDRVHENAKAYFRPRATPSAPQ